MFIRNNISYKHFYILSHLIMLLYGYKMEHKKMKKKPKK